MRAMQSKSQIWVSDDDKVLLQLILHMTCLLLTPCTQHSGCLASKWSWSNSNAVILFEVCMPRQVHGRICELLEKPASHQGDMTHFANFRFLFKSAQKIQLTRLVLPGSENTQGLVPRWVCGLPSGP